MTTQEQMVENSRRTIEKAQRVVDDVVFAVSETRRIYSNGQKWRRHQRYACLILARAKAAGLSADAPFVRVQREGYVEITGMVGGESCPMWFE